MVRRDCRKCCRATVVSPVLADERHSLAASTEAWLTDLHAKLEPELEPDPLEATNDVVLRPLGGAFHTTPEGLATAHPTQLIFRDRFDSQPPAIHETPRPKFGFNPSTRVVGSGFRAYKSSLNAPSCTASPAM
jgi:hypothetical protein